jgi:uncharacterized metal-binding protein YceD (DUF177 family)
MSASTDRPLTWNVAGLLADGVGTDRTYDVTDVSVDLPEDLTLSEPVSGTVRLTRTNRGVLADAHLHTALEYLPSIDLQSGRPVDEAGEPEALRLSDHHELDLEPSVSDAISLAEPIAPLDRPDCPGLCVVCGLPRDEGEHDHPDDDIDPRLEALRAFRPD